jgi:hypothetical protein
MKTKILEEQNLNNLKQPLKKYKATDKEGEIA